MNAKPIETRWKGYRFRSRLEARWAVFFEACGYEWEYEPEGFDLGDGVYYLPDFKVYGEDTNGDFNVFYLEVKPAEHVLTADEERKIDRFANLCEIGCGPCRGYGTFIILDGNPKRGKAYYSPFYSPITGDRWVVDPGYRGRPSFWENWHQYERVCSGRIADAPYQAAMGARFEHGEAPLCL